MILGGNPSPVTMNYGLKVQMRVQLKNLQRRKKSPPKGSTFNTQKAGLSDQEVANLWNQYSRPSKAIMFKILPVAPKPKAKAKPKVKSSISTKAGKLDIQEHGIKSTKAKPKKLKCSICNWSTTSETQLTVHVKQHHPNFHFRCKFCSKEYVTFSSKFKHQLTHGALKHVSKYCDRGFLFPS